MVAVLKKCLPMESGALFCFLSLNHPSAEVLGKGAANFLRVFRGKLGRKIADAIVVIQKSHGSVVPVTPTIPEQGAAGLPDAFAVGDVMRWKFMLFYVLRQKPGPRQTGGFCLPKMTKL
ncbi:hypothetical protein [Geomesophilobacter sediminis]|uniref:Uncharacterized protein n=1 Tax=Geomesophilobacter sediminis TaxID=2798584 RepID=A0A8J7SCE1_9BACT|nr:hypothetical protein [Geomesophilobacter sediminis]MBJ6727109.1 hypothetical protein [Geomesophilobacter sediminis]